MIFKYFKIKFKHKKKVGINPKFIIFLRLIKIKLSWECPRGLAVNALYWDIVVREFELQSRYNFHFQTKTPWKIS